MIRRAAASAALVLLGVVLLPRAAYGQVAGTVPVSGTVLSADGAPLPRARVVIEATPGGARRVVRTDGAGRFRVPDLPVAATYGVAITAEGHRPFAIRVSRDELASGAAAFHLHHPVVALAPLAVTGTGVGALRGIAGATRVIDRDALVAQRPAAAHELLRRTTGVHVQDDDALGLHLNIGIRGLDPRRSSRVLLLEDGVPIHLGPYTDPTAHYQPPAEVLQRVEVLRGAGQVAYGPQTVGGVINFVRRPPPTGPAGALLLRVGDRGRLTGHVHAGTASGGHAGSISLGRRLASGPRRGAEHEVDDAAAQLLFDLGSAGSLLLRAATYREASSWGETGLTQAEFERDPFHNPSPRDVFDLTRHTVQLVQRTGVGRRGEVVTTVYGQDLHRASWRQASSSSDRFGTDRYAAAFACPPDATAMADCGFQGRPRAYRFAGVEPRLRLWLAGGYGPADDAAAPRVMHAPAATAAILDIGGRLHVERAERRQFVGPEPGERGAEIVRDNVLTANAWSVFVQARVARGPITVTPGVRMEHVRSDNRNRLRDLEASGEYTRWLPGLGATWESGAATLFAGTHRGFAPPRPADVLSPQPGQSLVQVEPEVSWNHEVGIRARAPGGIAVEATAFRTDFRNQVVEGSRAGTGQRFVNAGTTLHQGIELYAGLEARARRFQPVAELAWTFVSDARYTSDQLSSVDEATPIRGRRLPFAPRHLLHAMAGVATGAGTHLSLRASRIGEQFADDLNTREASPDGQRGLLPACTTLSATANQLLASGRATIFATADNLRDAVCITERVEGIMVGSPRRFSAGLEWSF
jgi:Fe(3+) dicitrate transport protein